VSTTLTVEQVALVRRFVVTEAATTPLGRTWLRRLRPAAADIVRLYSGQARVRAHVERAAAVVAELVRTPDRRVDDDVVTVLTAAPDALGTSASPALADVVAAARDDLRASRGRTVREAFGL
jgi:hypothetical protein